MSDTTTTPAVLKAISSVQAALAKDGISKDRTNQQQGFKFRGIDDLLNALGPLLPQHNLLILPRVLKREVTERQTAKGGVIFSVVLDVEFDFVHNGDGSVRVVGPVIGEAMDTGDKASGKALSYAYKAACLLVFSVPTEGDNDADATTHEVAPQKQAPQKQKAQTAISDRLQAAAAKFDAALAAGNRGKAIGILSFATTSKGLPAQPLRILQRHATEALIAQLGKNGEAPEIAAELNRLALITPDDWLAVQAAMDADLKPTGATT